MSEENSGQQDLQQWAEQLWSDATFTDERVFQVAMCRDKDLTLSIIQALVDWQVDAIVGELASEKALFRNRLDKMVRLDIMVRTGSFVYGVEMENRLADRDELMNRLRIYGAQTDAQTADKGQDYKLIPGLCQICFCSYPPFPGKPWVLYPFSLYCPRLPKELQFGIDHVHKYVFYTKGTLGLEELKPEARILLNYMNTNNPGDNSLTKRIDEIVQDIKRDEDIRKMYIQDKITYRQDLNRARAEGQAEGEAKGVAKGEGMLQKLITAMKDAGKTLEFIVKETADSTKLPGLYKEYGITTA